jgi:1,4-dihydroxy-2-naphthoate octaprenyltransferase
MGGVVVQIQIPELVLPQILAFLNYYIPPGSSYYLYAGLFFGLVATMGTYFAQTGALTWSSLIVAIPMGCLSCALLAINNLRDRAADELVGKRTLAVRLGDSSARIAFIALLLVAHISVLLLLQPWTLLTLLLLPTTFALIKQTRAGATGADLIPLLGKTGKLQLRFAILLALGLLLS